MGQVLYRKYRSKSLNDIIGQEHITTTLQRAIESNRIAHAYLLTGPRGVGKTSVARIIAHNINHLAYDDDSPHIDIIELDGASNGRIDEIRELRDMVYVAPVELKYKVYIIDEVHMLSLGAFNALLKTLEEPPAHVVFILATTEAHKLPETIISRTQRFQFRPLDPALVKEHLKTIAKQESIKIDDQALALIAAHGQGSFRDAISLLDQAANYEQPISESTINRLLGIPSDQLVRTLVDSIAAGDRATTLSALDSLFSHGYSAASIAAKLSEDLRNQLVMANTSLPFDTLTWLLRQLIEIPASVDPDKLLEVCLAEAAALNGSVGYKPKTISGPAVQPAEPKPANPITTAKKAKSEVLEVKPPAKPLPQEPATANSRFNEQDWPKVLNVLKSSHNTLYGIVRMATIDTEASGTIKLKFAFPFHMKRINDNRNRQAIIEAITQVTGQQFALTCDVDKSLLENGKTNPAQQSLPEDHLSLISSIFGGGEVVSE